MSEGIPYADILILALVAVFILLRLRSVLGDRSGNESNYFSRVSLMAQPEPVIQLDEKSLRPKLKEESDIYLTTLGDGPVPEALRKMKDIDPSFTATTFMQGARMAFEMVFDAFAKGDKDTLRRLMADAVFQHFAAELDQRAAQTNKPETTLVSVAAKELTQATLEKNTGRIGVRFESEQVTVVRGSNGDIVEGNPSEIHHVEDRWIFERDLTSKNPNWKIIET